MTRHHLLRSMLTSLIKYGRITTTSKKAAAVKAYADNFFSRLVGYANQKDGTRNAIAYIKSVVYTEDEGKKALNELTPKFVESNIISWFTRSFKLGFRKGDTAEKVMITLA